MSAASRNPIGDGGLVEYLERADTHGNQFSLASSSAAGDPLLWIRGDHRAPLLINADDAREIILVEDVGKES